MPETDCFLHYFSDLAKKTSPMIAEQFGANDQISINVWHERATESEAVQGPLKNPTLNTAELFRLCLFAVELD